MDVSNGGRMLNADDARSAEITHVASEGGEGWKRYGILRTMEWHDQTLAMKIRGRSIMHGGGGGGSWITR